MENKTTIQFNQQNIYSE